MAIAVAGAMTFLRTSLLVAFTAAIVACTADVATTDFDDVPDEAALTTGEIDALPDGTEAEHAAELQADLAAEQPTDDASAYANDDVEPMVDVEVTDTEQTQVTPYAALLKWGIHPRASDAFRAAGVSSWRIMQTIGNAAASAGTHARDGYVNGQPYSAATDLSVSGLSQTEIANLLEKLAKVGFAAWYRHSGYDGWYGVNHIHAVYANCLMKTSLRSQVRSWLVGRNGLVSNTIYKFHTWSAAARAVVTAKFAMSGSGTTNGGAGFPGRVRTSGVALHIHSGVSLSSTVVGSVANGAYVAIRCQKHGGSVSGTYGTSTLWDRIGGGYVSDAYVSTGSDGQVAPTCP